MTPSASCNSTNCANGCCTGDTCVGPSSQSTAQCGARGALCAACGVGFQCLSGACADVDECATNNGGCDPHANCLNSSGSHTCTCQSGYAGDGVRCAALDAGIDSNALYLVQPTSAHFIDLHWDVASPPDVYVVTYCPTTAGETPKVSDSLDPTWSTGGCTSPAASILGGGVAFEVFDSSTFKETTMVQRTALPVTETALRNGSFTISRPDAGMTSMTFSFVKQ